MKYECKICKGQCCYFVPINKEEYLQFKKLGLKKSEVEKAGHGIFIMQKDETGVCPFLEVKKLCSIYDNRPAICRMVGTKQMPCMKMPKGRAKINKIAEEIEKRRK